MDEFKPEDELKPDASDRRPTRQQKRSSHFSVPKIALSKQHLMIAIGILVLLLIIIGIGSALQAPSHPQTSQPQSQTGGEKSIDLSSSSPMTQTETAAPVEASPAVAGQSPQTLSAPPIAGTPTEAQVQPQVSGQQRIELPGNITDALSQQQGRVNEFSQGAIGSSTLPTAPATVAPTTRTPAPRPAERSTHNNSAHSGARPSATNTQKAAAGKPAANASAGQSSSIQSAPASHFTLQLSSASRSDTLQAYAKQHNLTHSWVYETKRDGKPWYVLVSGVYASSSEARRAVATLPADVQAKKPWVKPIRQVKQDLNK
ncbi:MULTISPECIES: SPOR domain-containing protein [unclassified Brenneria]|uniref:SPOR domain-containing protein n=1 Tax=unclassified Brenneria TaxID=2634434 RepID=UPI001554FD89|nr:MULTISPECIES: SPOR domain-containing protein [unclassified Brenneria]MBJ7222965.1 SPOR domain-containing protein [Brenneria sp. L3-3C-1]MEE3644204.1 SPOR domain-containing protein [Brenneria sp. L3_3C_1]MEE3652428.1 SPOR domain-containing protein [Brenneria sp. HEZEL_4_2_4]NPD02385.1 SPOR domain-containing protein [Brenneria sp. hezel4-2-4]